MVTMLYINMHMQNFKYVYYKSLNLMHVTLFGGAPVVIHNAHSS